MPSTKPKPYGTVNARKALNVWEWQLDALVRHRHLAPPDDAGKWTEDQIAEMKERLPEALSAIGEQQPLGPKRCAALLAKQLELSVAEADVVELELRDVLAQARSTRRKKLSHEGIHLFDVVQVTAVGSAFRDLIAQLVADRVHWLGRSLSPKEAVHLHGMDGYRLQSEQDIRYGRMQRFAAADVEALKAGKDPRTWGSPDRLISADEAATRLWCRRVEIDHCIAAGLLTPAGHEDVAVSKTATRPVPLYRAADVDDLTVKVDANWDRFRWLSTARSPLGHLADRPGVRDPEVRAFVEDLQKRLHRGFDVAWTDRLEWELRWDHRGLAPTNADVRHEIETDRRVRHLADQIVFADR